MRLGRPYGEPAGNVTETDIVASKRANWPISAIAGMSYSSKTIPGFVLPAELKKQAGGKH